ncbi:MAG TPA: hypothetical protein VK843_20510 [Planctomycetota bacterium]|nr:hypothetical protein [Planctomycetota bacterium]
MKIRSALTAAVPLFLALQLAGCGDSPQPIDAPATQAPQAPSAAGVKGTVILEGAQFEAPTGTLFVSVRPKGIKAPWMSRKYPLEGATFEKTPEGAKRLSFELDPKLPQAVMFNSAPGQAPSVECEVYACYKLGATVDVPTVADAAAPYVGGKSDYVLTLKLP